MLRRIAVLALFLGTSVEAVNLRLYNQLAKDTPPELTPGVPAKKATPEAAIEATQADADATAAKAAAAAEKATAEATAAAANADPILTVNTAHNAPRISRVDPILDPKILEKNAAIAKAVQAAKDRVSAEPKIKAEREKYEMLLPVPLAPSQPLNPMNTSWRRARTAAEVPSHELGNPDYKSVAGPAETDQIGKSVYDSAMQGCDDTPNPRNILSKDLPSFTPGPLPPIPWPAAPVAAGVKAEPSAENKEVVVIKQKNPDAIPTKQDVANAVAKANKDMEEALAPSKNKADPINDPELAVQKVDQIVPTVSEVAGEKEKAKAEKVADSAIKVEKKEAAKVAVEIRAEKAKEEGEEKVKLDAMKAEDEKKAEEVKEKKKADEKKVEAVAAEKKVEEEKKDAENAKADAKIEAKAAVAEKEAAKELKGDAVEDAKAAKVAAVDAKEEAKAGDKAAAVADEKVAKVDAKDDKADAKDVKADTKAEKADTKDKVKEDKAKATDETSAEEGAAALNLAQNKTKLRYKDMEK